MLPGFYYLAAPLSFLFLLTGSKFRSIEASPTYYYYTEFTNLTGWTDDSQAGGNSSNYQITTSEPGSVNGSVQFSVNPFSLVRPKIAYKESILPSAGIHEWRAFVPHYTPSDVTTAGMFIYADTTFEVDFECGYGPSQQRSSSGIANDDTQILCATTSQSTDGKSLSTIDQSWHPITANQWHTFTITLSGSPFMITWSVDGTVVKTSQQQWGPKDIPAQGFVPHCSLEQLSFMGDYGTPIAFPAAAKIESRPDNQFWVDHYGFSESASNSLVPAFGKFQIIGITLLSTLTLHILY